MSPFLSDARVRQRADAEGIELGQDGRGPDEAIWRAANSSCMSASVVRPLAVAHGGHASVTRARMCNLWSQAIVHFLLAICRAWYNPTGSYLITSSAAFPMHPLRRQHAISWLATIVLSSCLGSLRSAEERSEPPLRVGPAKPGTCRSEDLIIPAGDFQLAGTLYAPEPGQPAPAVVFVHGAGAAVRSDRYQELGRHFARKGVAALIYDKRGCGASTGDWTRAGVSDLAEDALACVRLLRGRPEVNPAQVGLWGLSQGASIIPIAAGRSPEVAFVVAVGGCLDFEAQMRYFRANLFRRLGHPPPVLDIANKAFLIQVDLSNRIRSGSLPAPRAWRDACRFEFDLDQAGVWGQVRQPVLAIYGESDRHVPVAESSAALAVAQSGNRDFTLIIYPGASHSIGQTRTGELGEQWTGYVPEYLVELAAPGRFVVGLLDADVVGTPPRPLARAGGFPAKKNSLGHVRNLRDSLRTVSTLLEPPGAGLRLTVPV
jgi:pimeloyl-ACP methyl ester carboxylesterase